MGSRTGGVLAQVSDSLKSLQIEELKKLMEDQDAFDVYFEKNIPIVKEKQELIRAIKDSNIASAKKNVDLHTAIESLSTQVQELRQLVQERQAVLRPRYDEIKKEAMEDRTEAAKKQLESAAAVTNSECRQMVELTDASTDWNKFAVDFTSKKKMHHLQQALMERLENKE
ncbi:hypothetical protein GUITHDRAFT_151991 [Guillardia theta CCMP2712]|uniref:VPS37 C-terminal domain-containing protein n=1 Tax=Guillardia theta (strain CCMP2712) TaxID=905079 RepID=L1JI99_GUITC|nr:hypothetical protein GUITHDRAFT_151991 [Guillardia theta CCMP2712]EKX47864.1 hypothetical protein GUITHDRAFT_151991 [Guillardia theta CCMP2712]|eukprot:XP_005834844.1 hypothetical protein GUITHDRAFT_151991 [Guillardia theta CCMP2712]